MEVTSFLTYMFSLIKHGCRRSVPSIIATYVIIAYWNFIISMVE